VYPLALHRDPDTLDIQGEESYHTHMKKINKLSAQDEKIDEFIESSERIMRYMTYALIGLTVNVVILAIKVFILSVTK